MSVGIAMFSDLYDSISLWFSWRWSKAEGVITAIQTDRSGRGAQTIAVYEFSVGNDGPYTGEWPWYGHSVYVNALVGKKVLVRYRKDDPSVNRLDDGTEL